MNSVLRLVLVLLLGVVGAGAQEMAITVDDLPAHGNLPPHMSRLQVAQTMLKALKAANMPPVYGFINADGVDKLASEEAVLKAWRAAGQPLGNHTWNHPDFEKSSVPAFEKQIAENEPMLKKYMDGQDWHWFRYPFLHAGDTVEKRRAVRGWLAAHDYKIAEVTMDFEDYLWNDPYARCMAKGDRASIARLHDSYLATADEYVGVFRKMSEMVYGRDVKYILLLHIGAFDAKMLPELLELYKARGFSFISLEEASKDAAYADDPDIGYPTGGTQLELMMVKKKLKASKNSKPYKELAGMCR